MRFIESLLGYNICAYGCCGNELYCIVRSTGIIAARNIETIEACRELIRGGL